MRAMKWHGRCLDTHSADDIPTIGDQRFAGDVGRSVGRKENDQVGDFLR